MKIRVFLKNTSDGKSQRSVDHECDAFTTDKVFGGALIRTGELFIEKRRLVDGKVATDLLAIHAQGEWSHVIRLDKPTVPA